MSEEQKAMPIARPDGRYLAELHCLAAGKFTRDYEKKQSVQ